MILLATITLLSDHVREALTSANKVITELGTKLVANAALAIPQIDSITVETGRTQITGLARRIVKTHQTLARHTVARARLLEVDVAIAIASFAKLAFNFRRSIETSCTTLTLGASVSFLAVTADLGAIAGNVAACCKTKGNLKLV
jgi:hypothetical protein